MSLKSLYLPPQAMQGENIPSHILWSPSPNICKIKITLPESLVLLEIYNVLENNIAVSGQEITLSKFEKDGYLGLLLSSRILAEYTKREQLSFTFFDNKGLKTMTKVKSIFLFRPHLKVVSMPPKIINVQPEKAITSEKIKLKRLGQGTLIINFDTSPTSDVKKKVPDGIIEFLKNTKEALEVNIQTIINTYPQYSSPLNRYIRFLINPWKSYEELQELRTIAIELTVAMNGEEKFAESFTRAIGSAYAKNIKLFTLPESLLKYLDSVMSYKVWLVEPWQVIPVSKEPRKVKFRILPTNLLLTDYSPVELPEITVQGKNEGVIEIARLFEWT